MIDAASRKLIRERANYACEYCQLEESHVPFIAFHIEHVIPRKHGGGDSQDNLALACYHCNLHKGPNLAGLDPDTGEMVALFHPRRQSWAEHFEMRGNIILGLTPIGRATAMVLEMNSLDQLQLRAELTSPS